jgi:hypothetical protein
MRNKIENIPNDKIKPPNYHNVLKFIRLTVMEICRLPQSSHQRRIYLEDHLLLFVL